MSFLETIQKAKAYLEQEGRVSLSALRIEFDLDEARLEALIEELVDVQQVAAREGKVLSRIGAAPTESSALVEMEANAEDSAEPPEAPQAAEAERRQLTVMFCDLVGSTDLSQRLDAEDLRNVVRAYQESAAQVIERYEGHIAQYLGDGLLVYFGYPQAHEDDAERAVRAGREILTALGTLNERLDSELGIRVAVRVGVHTGPVVVGEMGGGSKSETLALGDTTNIAARLEGVAEPDTVVISHATLRLVSGMFVTEDLGSRPLKGITEAIRAYSVLQATGVRSRLDVDPSRLTPLVGRDQEVGLLLERWEQVQEGEGQAVLISGEAGLGKSRLLQAFRERLATAPHSWLECRCSSYVQGSAFHPLIELVEQGLGFKDGDDSETKVRRLERGVEAAGLSKAETVPLIAPFFSLPLPEGYLPLQMSPELQRKKTITSLVAWILGLAERQPLVMLFEDLQWCDPSTVEVLGLLLEQSPTAKVLTLLTFRPDFEPPWPTRSHLTRLAVNRLSRRQASEMVRGMTPDLPLPDAVVDRIVDRADGVPIFLEELTKMVLESGLVEEREGRYELTGPLTELAIPTTLQDSLMARLDRLREGKDVAQLGAALGREFLYELLRSVSPLDDPSLQDGLARLVDAELLYQRGSPPDSIYTFKHAMIQDTAYRSLLKSVRQQFHARIAEVLEERFPDRVESEPEVIARHYDEAGLAGPAVAQYQRAGTRAADRSANEEAIQHLSRGLELLAGMPESRERSRLELELQLRLGPCLLATKGYAHEDMSNAFARARELCREVEEEQLLSQALMGLLYCHLARAEFDKCHELGREFLALAQRTGDVERETAAQVGCGVPLFYQGQVTAALEYFERALALYDVSHARSHALRYAQDSGVTAQGHSALCLWHLGHPDQSREANRVSVELARSVGHPYSLAWALTISAWLHQIRRETQPAIEIADELLELTETYGFAFFFGAAKCFRGWAQAISTGGKAGIDEYREGFARCAETGNQFTGSAFFGMGSEAYASAGQLDRATRAAELGIMMAEKNGEHFWDAELQRLLGEYHRVREGEDGQKAESAFQLALQIAHEGNARSLELRAAMSFARLKQQQGKRTEAREFLQPVYDWFTEGFDTPDLKDAKALLEELA